MIQGLFTYVIVAIYFAIIIDNGPKWLRAIIVLTWPVSVPVIMFVLLCKDLFK